MTVDITGIDPDPAWMDTPVTVQATAAFSADGREQEQAVLGWIPEFRWKWEFLSDGTVTESDPALDPQQSGWSIWSPLNSATGTGTFPTGLVKQAKVTVQVRMVPTAGAPSAPVCQAVATEALDVCELKDVTNLHVVRFEQNSVTLAWDAADCPGVAGYMYHIEPDRATLTDVGTSTQVTIPNMTVGQTYTVGVHTYDALGHMTHTAYTTFTVASSPPPVPAVLVFPTPSGTAVDVLWAPAEAPDMDHYDVKIAGVALASAPHTTSQKFYLTTVNSLPQGQPVSVVVCAVNTAGGTSTKAACEVTPVPFHEMHATQKGTEEKRLALGKFNGATSWTTALNAVSAREQLRGVLTSLSNASYMCPIPAPGLSFFKGYDDYGQGGHYLDTSWLPVKIPTGDSWLAVPSHYVNVNQWNEILTQFARVLLWVPADWNQHVSSVTGTRSVVSCGGAFDGTSWAGAVAMLPAIYDMNKSSFPEFEPPTEFGFWGQGVYDPTFDWPWLIPWAMRMTGSIVLTFASDSTVDWFEWTDYGSSVAPGGFCTVNYPEGYFPAAGSAWGDPFDLGANEQSHGYGDCGRVCYNIYAKRKAVTLMAADPSEFEFLPSQTITYTTVGEKVPVWIKVKYANPFNAAQPVWIPAKVQCASANAFICNQGCDPELPNGDCASASSVFVALAPGEYTLSAPAGGTRTVYAIGVDLDLAGVADDMEESVGGFVRWNADNDNGGDWPDYLCEGAISGEDDLMALILNPVEPAAALAPLDFVKLTWDSGAVKVYANPDRSGEISSGATVATSSLPRTFYVEGYGVSGLREVTFTLEYKTDDGRSFTDTVKATVLTVDTVFQCKTEKTEEDPGGFLVLNDDDDAGGTLFWGQGNGVADNTEIGPLDIADPDLQQIALGLSPIPDKGVAALAYDATKMRLWSTAKKEGLISSTGLWDLSVPAERADFVANVVGTRYVEGYATGTGEVILAWESATDKVKITVVDIDIQFQGLPEERNATPPIPNEENPGGFLAVNENDDNSNGQPDKNDPTPLAVPDPDLKPITFSMPPLNPASPSTIPSVGTVTLSVPPHLKLWTTQQKNDPIVSQFWDLSIPVQKSAFLTAMLNSGGQRWVEGIASGEGYLSLSYDAAPECSDKVNVTVLKVDLDIANGQGGFLLDEDKEETPGAFTAANLNDTDGDGATDKDDGDVPGEEDLMQLVLRKPEPDLSDKVKLTLPAGVKLWKNATKSSGEETGTEFNTSDLPKTLWVEVTAKSGALRDREIEMEYKGCKDKVQLTGVWTEKTGMKNQNAEALWADAGDPMKTTFNNVVGKFGISFAAPSGFFHYSIGLEFTVSPSGIGGEPGIVFDVTRQIEFKDWTIDAGVVSERKPWKFFLAADTANDDTNQSDEDNTPENDHVYVVDGPGENNNGDHDQVVSRNNFYEFTRVRFDGAALSGNNDTGSRCSDKIGWHAFYWVEKDGGKYKQRAGKINEVNEGHGTLDPAPVP